MAQGAAPNPTPSGPPPGVTLTPLPSASASAAAGPPPGVTLTPLPPASSATPPAASQTQGDPLTANPGGEGTYQMQGPQGTLGVPYSKVEYAKKQGLSLTPTDAGRYTKDFMADPVTRRVAGEAMSSIDPSGGLATGAIKTAVQVPNTLLGWLDTIANKAQSAAEGSNAKPEPSWKQGAENLENRVMPGITEPTHGVGETTGGIAEQMAEWLYGEGEARAAYEGLSQAGKLKQLAKVTGFLEEHPVIAGAIRHSMSGAAAAGQQLAHGATPTQAAEAGVTAGAGGVALESAGELAQGAVRRIAPEMKTVGATEIPVSKGNAPKPPTPAQAAGAQAYANEARAAAAPHLEALNAATPEPHMTWGIDDAGNYTEPVQSAGLPNVNVDQLLSTTHDFTGVAQKMTQANSAAYDALDKMTGGDFRKVNEEVKAARAVADESGSPEDWDKYKNAQTKMSNLLDGVDKGTANAGNINLQAIKNSWTQSYALADIGKALDKSLNGLPGDTAVSQAQRGINGNTLDKQLRNVARSYGGADNLRDVLGPGRLENLQAIADATRTNAGRTMLNQGIRSIAEYLPASYLGYKIGEHLAGPTGGAAGAASADAMMYATRRVLNAVRTDPRIGQNLLFAINSGARPASYGPLIAGMMVKANTEQQQPQESK
jgi:hypothetical protein